MLNEMTSCRALAPLSPVTTATGSCYYWEEKGKKEELKSVCEGYIIDTGVMKFQGDHLYETEMFHFDEQMSCTFSLGEWGIQCQILITVHFGK